MNGKILYILTLLVSETTLFPRAPLSSAVDTSLPVVTFDHSGGYFNESLTLAISCENPSDSIYFSLDGAEPDCYDFLYSAPLYIESDMIIRARVIRNGTQLGPITTATYYTSIIHDIPVVCLSTDPYNLWDEDSGIYADGPSPGEYPYFGANYWQDWERPVHVELYDVKGIKQIDQDAGIKIYGAWSRASGQKSFALYARKAYGKGKFCYKFFADKDIDKFESFILRNSGDDNMGLQFHDCFMSGLTRNMDIDRLDYEPAAVYLNGEYWGLLNIREKISTNYIESNHFIKADSVNLLERNAEILNGTNSGYNELIDYIDQKSTLQNDEDYTPARNKIDVNNFIQYELTEIYLNNRDWPDNNIKFWNSRAPGGKWRWILFDTDFGYGIWNVENYKLNTLDFALEADGPESPNPPWATLLLRRMMTNETFRNNFINQFCDRLNLDFNPPRINADLDSFKELYDQEIEYHFNRWWGNYDEWLEKIENRRIFGQNRPEYCRLYLQSQFNLEEQLDITVNVSGGEGDVKINTILPYNYPFTGIYFRNLPVKLEAIPRPGYRFLKWEGSVNSTEPSITFNMESAGSFTAVFVETIPDNSSIVINEINYSSSATLDTKDWIELFNKGNTTIDLSGWKLIDSGVDSGFIFKQGTLLAPGSYLIICRSLSDFAYYHSGIRNIAGNMMFKVSAQGELIRLYDSDNNLVDRVSYGTAAPWPSDASGTGKTIELVSPDLDNSLPGNWHSSVLGGTPGETNSLATKTGSIFAFQNELNCFPNPFRNNTTISLNVSSGGKYKLEVMDLQGKSICVLADQSLSPGSYWIDFSGSNLCEGIYLVRLCGNGRIDTKKIVKIR